ncbi:MAG: putative entry exclusion protein TrbK-alt, partial [Pseudomonadota bacterium]
MARLAKLLFILGVAVALLPLVILTLPEGEADPELRSTGLVSGTPPGSDGPDAAALRRCRDMGSAALDDQTCLDLWAESRRRFLGETSS